MTFPGDLFIAANCRRLFSVLFGADKVADIRTLSGQYLVIEILLPVDIGRAVLQLLNGAAQLGMTREQARQIEASALRRLRRPSGHCAKRVIDSFAEVRDSDEGIRRDG